MILPIIFNICFVRPENHLSETVLLSTKKTYIFMTNEQNKFLIKTTPSAEYYVPHKRKLTE